MTARRIHRGGFTLAELIVASTVLTIVMGAVYTVFGSTIRTWRTGERNLQVFQNARAAMDIMSHELGCMLGGAEHLFKGKRDDIEFYAVTEPMDVTKGEGARVLWIRYHYNRTGKTLVREEALVLKPLPLKPAGNKEVDHGAIKKGQKHKFDLVAPDLTAARRTHGRREVVPGRVLGFEISYYWIPIPKDRKLDEPPQWIEPIEMKESREGWGLPQGIKVVLTLSDPSSQSGKSHFTYRTAFRGPTTPYDDKLVGVGEEGS